MTIPDPGTPEPGPGASVNNIQADIEATRQELGQTVEALTAKLDVKQQARDKVADTKKLVADKADALREKGSEAGAQIVDVATDDEGSVRPVVPLAALALSVLVIAVVVRRRRR